MLNPAFSGEGYTHNLCNALSDSGHDVDLFTGPHFHEVSQGWERISYRPLIRFYRHTQLRTYRARGAARVTWRIVRLLGHVWSMFRTVAAARRYDLVHVHFLPVPRLDVWFLSLIAKRKTVVYTAHNLYPHGASPDGPAHRLFFRIYHSAHYLIGHTQDTVDGLIHRFGIPATKVSLIPSGNYNHLRKLRHIPSPEDLGIVDDRPLILLVGHLRANKGIDVLVEAAAVLRDRDIPFRVLIAGSSHMGLASITDRVHALGLDALVEVRPGYIEEEAFAGYLLAATVVTLPYKTIDQSGVALAAVSLGCPIVVSDIAGLGKIVRDCDCGIAVPVGDPSAIADALERILSERTLREQMAERARIYADGSLAWETIAEATQAAYRKAEDQWSSFK